MGMYTIPDGVISKLHVKGDALFDASARVVGNFKMDASANVGGAFKADGTANIVGAFETLGSSELGDATTDTIGFYGTAPIAAVASPDSPDASLSQLKVAIDSLEDKLTAYGILRGT